MNYEPQVRSPRGVDPQVRYQSGRCDVCGKSRAHHKHDKCSKARQVAGFVRWKETPANTPVKCAQCNRVHRFDEMMGNTCRGCHVLVLGSVMSGECPVCRQLHDFDGKPCPGLISENGKVNYV